MPELAVLRSPDAVLFGTGMAAAAGAIAARFGRRAFVVTDPVLGATPGFEVVVGSLRDAGVDAVVFADAAIDVPMATIEAAHMAARAARPDAVVAVGGGSAIDLAKVTALLLAHGGPLSAYYGEHLVPGPVVPLIALPTTAGTGSEVTPVSVIGDPDLGMKVGISSPYLIPRTAICDPELTRTCPPSVTAHSGIDALSHAIEAFMAVARPPAPELPLERVAVGKNALSDVLALAAVREIGAHLDRAVADGDDMEARAGMLFGSLNAGLAFANSGVSVAHALQFAIGAATGTPHGLGTGMMLPYVMAFNRPAREPELAALAAALGEPAGDAVEIVHALGLRIGLPARLADLELPEERLAPMGEQAAGIRRLAGNNPRPVEAADCTAILRAAWHGDPSLLAEPAPA
jgi:alcohol dehydrogenase class IV